MIHVLHTGDLHLDAPMRGLAPEKARQFREEQRDLVERLRDLAEAQETDLLLISGDLFDGDTVCYETTHMLAEVFGRMKAKIFIAPGNHDPYSDHSPYASVRWPDNVHIFTSNYFERVELPELGAAVYGVAFTSKYRDTSPMTYFRSEKDEGLARIMVLHGDLNAPRSRYAAVSEDQLAAAGMDYVALGHVHAHTKQHLSGSSVTAYCGCPQGRGFDETGERGVLTGTVAPGDVHMQFVPVCRRKYWDIAVKVTGKDPEKALRRAIPSGSGEDIARFRMTGTRKGDPLDEEALRAKFQDRFFELQVRDETVPALDLWERAEEDNLTGLFLRSVKGRLEAAPPEERPVLERAARFGLAALEGREEPQ